MEGRGERVERGDVVAVLSGREGLVISRDSGVYLVRYNPFLHLHSVMRKVSASSSGLMKEERADSVLR